MSERQKKIKKKGIGSIFELDAFQPDQIAKRVLRIGVKKVRFPAYKTIILGMMGGGFISLGALYELYVMAHPYIEEGVAVLIAPMFYAMGYIIAFISGAEVFTTNNLAAMGWASGRLDHWDIIRNWSIVLFANILGAFFIVLLYFYSGLYYQYDFAMIDVAKTLSAEKLSHSPLETVIIGIFGNMLICSGLWLAMAGRSVTDRLLALFLPIAAVPAMNFQHCTGNMFLFFFSLITETETVDLELPSEITIWAITGNMFFVSIGNIIGGGLFIAVIYYLVYLRKF